MAADRSPAAPLVGRSDELAQLLAGAGVTVDPGPDAMLLAGDAGIGKTRLLRELVDRARDAGHRVMVGHCLDLGDGAMPYQPFVEAFGRLEQADRDDLHDALPALDALLPGGAADGVERAELFAAVVAALARLAGSRPLLLVLEDVHWADASTRHLVRYVLAHTFAAPVHLVVSYRSDDLHRRHPLRQAVAEWVRLPGVRRLELLPLPDDDVVALVQSRAAGSIGLDGVTALVRRAAGNAFYAEELLDAGLADTRSPLPETLADLLLVRLDRLDDDARAVVRAASCAGGRVTDQVLSDVVGLPPDRLDEALRSAIDHKVLSQVDGAAYGFRHALLSEAVHDDLLPGERRRIHAAYLDVLAAQDVPGGAAEVAMHAASAGDLPRAFSASVQAAEVAVRVSGYEEAAHHYEQALDLVDAAPPDHDLVHLVVRTADALSLSGETQRGAAIVRDALRRLPADAPPHDRGRLLVMLGDLVFLAGHEAEAERAATEALAVVPDEPTPLRGEAVALQARVLSSRRRDAEAIVWGEQALAIGEQLEAVHVIADARATLTRIMARSGADPEESRQAFRELVDSSRAAGHVLGELRGLDQLAFVAYNAGDIDTADEAFRQGRERAEATGWSWAPYGFDGRFFGALIAYVRGRWDEALALCTVGPEAPAAADSALAAVAMLVHAGRGDTAQIERTRPHWPSWRADVAESVHSSTGLLELQGVLGDLDAARRVLDDIVELSTRTWDEPYFPARVRLSACLLGQYCRAAPGLERSQVAALVPEAAALEEVADRAAEVNTPFGPEGVAWQLRVHAEAARLRWLAGVDSPSLTALEDVWQRTAAAFEALGDPYEHARSSVRLAAVLRAAGRDDDARVLVAAAREVAERLGARPLLDEVADTGGRAPRAVDDELTPREREVLEQVSAGRTNGEIAARLFISTKTVSVHVSNILAKLQAGSRTEAAAIARRRGLLDD